MGRGWEARASAKLKPIAPSAFFGGTNAVASHKLGHTVILSLHPPRYRTTRFRLSTSCPCREAPSSDRSSPALVPVCHLSRTKPHCLLVLRLQALAHGQGIQERRKLTRHLVLMAECDIPVEVPINALTGEVVSGT